jgi:hypothetical protein
MGKLLLLILGFVIYVQAHMSVYVPSMWGSEPDNINSNWAVQPLQDQDFKGWWFHGAKSLNDPPAANTITQLPAGGTYDFEITGNKAFTSMGRGLWVKPGASPRDIPNPWSNDMGGGSSNIHAPTHADVAGCALGIAYKSNINDVNPSDFLIFSVVHDCIARQLQVFDIPALPACPNGKCICGWFWVHNSTGGTDQMYMTGFQCNIANPSKRVLGKPSPPVRCDGKPPCYLYPKWGNTTTVCRQPLQPLYWANNQGNNIANPVNSQCAPTYNVGYGWADGAQNQIFSDAVQALPGSVGDTLLSSSADVLRSSPSAILVSPGFYTKLVVRDDGNVVLLDVESEKVHWSTNAAGVNGVAPYYLVMQKDGNLVLKDSKANIFWHSNTANTGYPPYKFKLRDMVSLAIVDSNGTPVWTADTM